MHKLSWYKPGKTIKVSDKMQKNYEYKLSEMPGKNLEFKPELSPSKMLQMGVFEGKYLNDCINEFPAEWYAKIKSSSVANPLVNYFKVKSRLSLKEWQKRGWIIGDDPRGWFQWYCRYWLGRRDPLIDQKQIRRYNAFTRHKAQILHSIERMKPADRPKTLAAIKKHRPVQRQALLQWAYNPLVK